VSGLAGMSVSTPLGADWVQGSLAQGSGLATMMTLRLDRMETARLLAPEVPGAGSVAPLDDYARGIRSSDSDQVAKRVLESFAEVGVRTLVVEDDLARRGDPGLGADVAFLSDRVIRWADLAVGAVAAVRLLRTGSSGYPLNAFACWGAPVELGLEAGKTLDESRQASLVDSTCAVITSIYDAEAYLLLMSHDLEVRIR
jgi:hypothetical protein